MSNESEELLEQSTEPPAASDSGAGGEPDLELIPAEKLLDDGQVQLWRGSCGEVLHTLHGVTGVITDPPWHFYGYVQRVNDADKIDPDGEARWFKEMWLWYAAWLTLTVHTGAQWGWYFISMDHAPAFLRICKLIGQPVRLGIPYANQAEWLFQIGEPIYTDESAIRRCLERRGYESVKPVGLILDLLAYSRIEPGATILDPFCGSGSTLKALQAVPWLNLKGIGVELREATAQEAAERLRT